MLRGVILSFGYLIVRQMLQLIILTARGARASAVEVLVVRYQVAERSRNRVSERYRVNLDAGALRIHWQRTATSSEGAIEKAPKGKSKRTVAIGSTSVTVLQAHQRRQEAEKEAAADLYEDGGYVFCREDGHPYYPRYLTEEWERCCRAAGVPVIALHDARHTSATTGADAGVPQHVMKDRLGHASRRTTDEVYTHVLDHSARKAAELMETAIFGPTQPPVGARGATARSHPTRRLAAVRRRIQKAA